jgi:hypothetical protein
MSNKKILYFVGITIVVILLFLSFYLATKQSPGAPSSTPTTTASTLVIPIPGGGIPVNNITQNPIQEVSDTVVFAKTDQYSILYYTKEQTFSINILALPAQAARDAAEAALLQKLGVTKDQVCNLTVSTFVPFDVDQNLAGTDYGLSFCPSGKPFGN